MTRPFFTHQKDDSRNEIQIDALLSTNELLDQSKNQHEATWMGSQVATWVIWKQVQPRQWLVHVRNRGQVLNCFPAHP